MLITTSKKQTNHNRPGSQSYPGLGLDLFRLPGNGGQCFLRRARLWESASITICIYYSLTFFSGLSSSRWAACPFVLCSPAFFFLSSRRPAHSPPGRSARRMMKMKCGNKIQKSNASMASHRRQRQEKRKEKEENVGGMSLPHNTCNPSILHHTQSPPFNS